MNSVLHHQPLLFKKVLNQRCMTVAASPLVSGLGINGVVCSVWSSRPIPDKENCNHVFKIKKN